MKNIARATKQSILTCSIICFLSAMLFPHLSFSLENSKEKISKTNRETKISVPQTTITGVVTEVITDLKDGKCMTDFLFMTEDKQIIYLDSFEQLIKRLNLQVKSGSKIKISGEFIPIVKKHTAKVDKFKASSIEVLEIQESKVSSLGPQKVLVLPVYYQGDPNPEQLQPIEQVKMAVYNINDYYVENSYGKISLQGVIDESAPADILDWYQLSIDLPEDTSWYIDVLNYAINEADPLINFNDYSRLIILTIFPGSNSGYGKGTIGSWTIQTPDGPIEASVSWCLYNNVPVAVHELGHNFGLKHANSLYGDNAILPKGYVDSFLSGRFDFEEYGEQFSTMGSGSYKHFNALHKELVGWLEPTNIHVVTRAESGIDFTLFPIEANTTELQVLKIPRPSQIFAFDLTSNSYDIKNGLNSIDLLSNQEKDEEYIYVEYRQPIGYDTKLDYGSGYYNIFEGALIHIDKPFIMRTYGLNVPQGINDILNIPSYKSTESLLINTSPGQNRQEALCVGKSITDPLTNITITVVDNIRDLDYPENSRLIVRVDFPE